LAVLSTSPRYVLTALVAMVFTAPGELPVYTAMGLRRGGCRQVAR
jgi:hypothetical protein